MPSAQALFAEDQDQSGLQAIYEHGPSATALAEAGGARPWKFRAHSGGSATDLFFNVESNSGATPYLAVTRDGNVGVGGAPTQKLHVFGVGASVVVRFETDTTAALQTLQFNNSADAKAWVVGQDGLNRFFVNYDSPVGTAIRRTLTIDDATGYVGIGDGFSSTAPAAILDIQAASAQLRLTVTDGTNYTQFDMTTDLLVRPVLASAPTSAQFECTSLGSARYGIGVTPVLGTLYGRGTVSIPTAVQSGDLLGRIVGRGWATATTGFAGGDNAAGITVVADEAFTDTARGAHLRLYTVPTASIAAAERIRILAAGQMLLGETTLNDSTALFETDGIVRIWNDTDVSATGGGSLRVGASTTTFIAIDNNEIQKITTGAPGQLSIHADGGSVSVFQGTAGFLVLGSTARVGTELLSVRGAGVTYATIATSGATSAAGLYLTNTADAEAWLIKREDTGSLHINYDAPQGTFVRTVAVIDTNGEVGLGTTTPDARLHVVGSLGTFLCQDTEADATNTVGRWGMQHYTKAEEPFYAFVLQSLVSTQLLDLGGGSGLGNAATQVRIFTAATNTTLTGTERVRVTSTGYVGINHTLPAYMLNVRGDSAEPGIISSERVSGTDVTHSGHVVLRRARGTIGAEAQVILDDRLGAITAQGYTDASAYSNSSSGILFRAAENYTATAQGGYVTIVTCPIGSTTLSERVRVTDVGFVGVNTTAPVSRLEVVGQGTFRDSTNSGSPLTVLDLRRTRADATAPVADFGADATWTLEGFTDGSLVTAVRQRGAWETNQIDNTTSRDSYWAVSTMANNSLGEGLRLTSARFLGINTTTPSARLHVELLNPGSGSFAGFFIGRTYTSFGDVTRIDLRGSDASSDTQLRVMAASGHTRSQISTNSGTTIFLDMILSGAGGSVLTSGANASVFQVARDLHVSSTAADLPRGRISAKGETLFAPANNRFTSVGAACTANGVSYFFSQALVGTKISAGGQTRTITATSSTTAFTVDSAFSPDIANELFTVYRPVVNLQTQDGTTRFLMTYDGEVGINTLVPVAQLHVVGQPATSGTPYSVFRADGATHTGLANSEVVYADLFATTPGSIQYGTGTTLALQRQVVLAPTTLSATTTKTVTVASLLELRGAPGAGTNLTIEDSSILRLGAAGTTLASVAGLLYSTVQVTDHTLTISGATTVTSTGPAGISIGILTVSAGGTVTNASGLYIKGAPTGATNNYAIWSDAGLNRFDGSMILGEAGAQITFFGGTLTSQQAVAALTNNVASGGTNDVIDNWTDLTIYMNDAAAIRNAIYQLARKLAQVVDAGRNYSLYS